MTRNLVICLRGADHKEGRAGNVKKTHKKNAPSYLGWLGKQRLISGTMHAKLIRGATMECGAEGKAPTDLMWDFLNRFVG
jgi:hypothetical protein